MLVNIVLILTILFLQVLGIDFSDPVVWGTGVGVLLIALGYVFRKARWILEPLGMLLKVYAGYKKDTSDGGKELTEKEKADMWENHVMPLLEEIGERLGNPLIDKIFGLKKE